MGRRIERRTVIIDGHEMIALRPADFDRLDASRRQVGARGARLTRLHQELHEAKTRLAQIEAAYAEAGATHCVCRQVSGILADHPAAHSR